MKLCANSSVWMCLLALALMAGCEKKRSAPPSPPAPTSTPMPTPTPEAQETQKTNDEPQTAAQGTPPPDPGKVADADNTDKSKAKPPHPRPTPKKPQQPAQTTTARNAPPKIVVKPEGPEPSSTPGAGQISPNPPNTEVSHDQATTEQLLQSSESSINNLKRTLTTDEQAIVAQIRDYVNQSRQAIKDNDLTRAHTLALKAHLLSDELIKRR